MFISVCTIISLILKLFLSLILKLFLSCSPLQQPPWKCWTNHMLMLQRRKHVLFGIHSWSQITNEVFFVYFFGIPIKEQDMYCRKVNTTDCLMRRSTDPHFSPIVKIRCSPIVGSISFHKIKASLHDRYTTIKYRTRGSIKCPFSQQ